VSRTRASCPVCTAQPCALPAPTARRLVERTIAGLGARLGDRGAPTPSTAKLLLSDLAQGVTRFSQYDNRCAPKKGGGRLVAVPPPRATTLWASSSCTREGLGQASSTRAVAVVRLSGSRGAVVDIQQPLAGHAALEVVTGPTFSTPTWPRPLASFLQSGTIVALGVSGCDMEKVSLRVDATSACGAGEDVLPPRIPTQNMNSFTTRARLAP